MAKLKYTITRVSPYERDQQCEHGDGMSCERSAAAWTVTDGNGYVVACADHAVSLVRNALALGEIVDAETLEPIQALVTL